MNQNETGCWQRCGGSKTSPFSASFPNWPSSNLRSEQLLTGLSRSAGPAAREVERQVDSVNRKLRRSAKFGVENHIRSELTEVFEECSQSNWDGYNALPVTYDSYLLAERFLIALPLGMPLPSIGAEPDGQFTCEWSTGARRCLSISFDPSGDLHFAALTGPGRACGSVPFVDSIPQTILDLIRQVI